uniref:Uncharacterized protein n=1 Tax=Rhizophagus irregularis (strain DAOM 181602 / DAOM 197198 / MUCL 43194) TaxID=747089 RepID=U9UI50_RHIID
MINNNINYDSFVHNLPNPVDLELDNSVLEQSFITPQLSAPTSSLSFNIATFNVNGLISWPN